MLYNVKGIIERIDLLKEGSSEKGEWKLYAYLLKTSDKPSFIYLSIFNPDPDIVVGNYVSVDFEVVAVARNDRYFNSVNAKSVSNLSPKQSVSQTQTAPQPTPVATAPQPATYPNHNQNDDFPF